jgi:hypothetical protein
MRTNEKKTKKGKIIEKNGTHLRRKIKCHRIKKWK